MKRFSLNPAKISESKLPCSSSLMNIHFSNMMHGSVLPEYQNLTNAEDLSGCTSARWKMSKLDERPAHVCHVSSNTLPTLAMRGVIDWEVDYASSSQVVGRQRHITPDCCISQSVRPQFLATESGRTSQE